MRLLIALLLAIPLFFISLPIDPAGPINQLSKPAHILFFALLALALARLEPVARLPFPRQAGLVLLVILVFGGAVELIQPFFGRMGSFRDVGANLAGGFFGLVFLAPGRCCLHRGALAAGQVLAVTLVVLAVTPNAITIWDMKLAERQFPVLSDFETRFEASAGPAAGSTGASPGTATPRSGWSWAPSSMPGPRSAAASATGRATSTWS
jgi:VanZ family protein